VVEQYRTLYIPKALELAEELVNSGGEARFVWTTGSWLIYEYLKHADEEQTLRLEKAIKDGHIVWHGLPFTTHTELMDSELFNYGLSISKRLDQKYAKTTISAKMTDVPGHTIAIVPHMAKQGIRYLHLGVNPASKKPAVPDIFVWKDEDGSELIVHYAKDYGNISQIAGLREVLVFAHTGDNCGPPSADDIRQQFADLAGQFPGAKIKASTLDAFAAQLLTIKDQLPIVTEELGDTWIHGVGTDPHKVAHYRELLRLRKSWVEQGVMQVNDEEYNQFSDALLMIPEHTWGADEKKYLSDYKHYAIEDFKAARQKNLVSSDAVPSKYAYIAAFALNEKDTLSAEQFAESKENSYAFMERSWKEQREYLDKAIAALSEEKQSEVRVAFQMLEPKEFNRVNDSSAAQQLLVGREYNLGSFKVRFASDGSIERLICKQGKLWANDSNRLGEIRYETFGQSNYNAWLDTYSQNLQFTHPWADADFSKPGMEYALPKPIHQLYVPSINELWQVSNADGDIVYVTLQMPSEVVEQSGAPERFQLIYTFSKHTEVIGIELSWFNKQANRLPEGLWFSFAPRVDNPNLWKMDKLGSWISPLNVVKDGNRSMHALNRGVSYDGADGQILIESLDASLVCPGERRLLRFDNQFASLDGGMHFNLYNNIWGTNFPMWYEEDAKFRFKISLEAN
jgi:hypothetical protein